MALAAKSFSDLITFTRACTAGYYGSDGLYKTAASGVARTGAYADYKPADITQQNLALWSSDYSQAAWVKTNSFVQTNLALWSEDFTNAVWTKGLAGAGVLPVVTANQGIAPDGTLTADRIDFNCGGATNSDRSYIYQNVASTNGIPYASSYYIKAFDAGSVGKTIRYTVETGVSSQQVIITLTSEWQRVSNILPAAGVNYNALLETRGTVTSSATASVLVWGYQLVQGSVAGDYRATTSAALPILYADPLGTTLAMKLCEDTTAAVHHRLHQLVTVPASSSDTNAFYIKAGERTAVRLINYDGGANYAFLYVNLATGATNTSGTNGTVSGAAFSVTPSGGGWYRIAVAATIAGTNRQIYINTVTGTSTDAYTGDGSSGIYIFGAQVNEGATALPYLATTAAGAHATTTGAKLGFLVEPQRTNLLLRSNDWSATWGLTNVTQTAAQAIGPDGTLSMTKLAATASVATSIIQTFVATSTSHTYSIYVKQGSGATDANLFYLRNVTTSTNLAGISINYATGVITQPTGTGAIAQPIGYGIWRISMPATSGITIGDSMAVYAGFIGNNETAGEYFYAYGAQVEAGSEASSYIPTTAAQVTRADDIQNVNVVTPWHSATEGTYLIEFQTGYTGACSRSHILLAHDASATKRLVYISNGGEYATSYDGVTGTSTSTDATGMVAKVALAYDASGRYMSVRGAAVTSAVNVAGFTSASSLSIGGWANWNLPAWIRLVKFYPRRFTNAELQALTA